MNTKNKTKKIKTTAILLLATLTLWVPQVSEARGKAGKSTENQKKLNFRTDTLLLLGGQPNAEIDYKVAKAITVGAMAGTRSATLFFLEMNGFVAAARANYYLSGEAFSDSFMVSPMLGIASFDLDLLGASAKSTGLYAGTMVSYQWVWNSGINLNLGAGANYYSNDAEISLSNDAKITSSIFTGIDPTLELTLGYAI